jgi:hypothetical protein
MSEHSANVNMHHVHIVVAVMQIHAVVILLRPTVEFVDTGHFQPVRS